MRPEERAEAEAVVRRMVAAKGYETLRITISNSRHLNLTLDADPGPITLEDVTFMNHRVREALATIGLDPDSWSVEVQSPGVNRPLFTIRHFERFVGERVRLRLKEPRPDGNRILAATIAAVHGSRIRVQPPKGEALEFGLGDLAEATLDPELPY